MHAVARAPPITRIVPVSYLMHKALPCQTPTVPQAPLFTVYLIKPHIYLLMYKLWELEGTLLKVFIPHRMSLCINQLPEDKYIGDASTSQSCIPAV